MADEKLYPHEAVTIIFRPDPGLTEDQVHELIRNAAFAFVGVGTVEVLEGQVLTLRKSQGH